MSGLPYDDILMEAATQVMRQARISTVEICAGFLFASANSLTSLDPAKTAQLLRTMADHAERNLPLPNTESQKIARTIRDEFHGRMAAKDTERRN